MTETQFTLFATILGAITGGILGIVGSYIASFGLAKRQALKDATDTFTDIFEAIVAVIRQNPDLSEKDIAESILKKNYIAQVTAMKSLSRRLCGSQRQTLTKAWQKYIDPDNCGNEPFLSYIVMPYEVGKSYDREYILDAIEHLISFANK